MAAALGAGFAVLGVFGGCGPSAGTCSPDLHTVLDSSGNASSTCNSDEACTTANGNAGCAKCDPTQCLPNNTCASGWATSSDAIKADAANKTTACRLTCTKPTDCPFNFTCVGGDGGNGYCAQDRTAYTPSVKGEPAGGLPWGAPCDPTKGFDQNSDCDVSQQFWCYGASPTDANAFCTQYQCTDDADCPGGWWCASVNDSPNVTGPCTAGTSIAAGNCKPFRPDWGTTTTVCLPRVYENKPGTYCAPCNSDVDCPAAGGTAQHCVSADANGGDEKVCATECQTDGNCPPDEACLDPGTGTQVCVPRAQTCKGDGTFCSPCHSDDDCSANGGFCVQADYSTEHFCTAPTPTCSYNSTTGYTDTCPTLPDLAKPPNTTTDGVGCSYNNANGIPTKQCYAGNPFGLGCYTYHCSGSGGACGQNSDCCAPLKCNVGSQACQ
ncbi:MAG TPA: hypothetical protein VGH28_20965 [Polyangiaceae bacterium]|jgi:hypothetical protein